MKLDARVLDEPDLEFGGAARHIDPRSGTAAKCNFCTHRVDRGLQPACVEACPAKAIPGRTGTPDGRLAQEGG